MKAAPGGQKDPQNFGHLGQKDSLKIGRQGALAKWSAKTAIEPRSSREEFKLFATLPQKIGYADQKFFWHVYNYWDWHFLSELCPGSK